MKNPFKSLDSYLIKKRLNKINDSVVDKFNKYNIKIDKKEIFILDQKSLSAISFLERSLNDISLYNRNIRINGLYSVVFDQILIDKSLIRFTSENYISLVLAHEYSHMISSKFNKEIIKDIYNKRNFSNNENLEIKLIENNSNEFKSKDIEEKILESISNLGKIKRTKSEIRHFEFTNYIEEMFAQSIAENLYGNKNSERNLKSHSILNSGNILFEDKEFFKKTEFFLYKRLFHNYSKKTLKEIIIEFPKLKFFLELEYQNHFKEFLE